jgi:hypothetical protein
MLAVLLPINELWLAAAIKRVERAVPGEVVHKRHFTQANILAVENWKKK